jgi:D-alanyl-D-alanine carboxypeptidase
LTKRKILSLTVEHRKEDTMFTKTPTSPHNRRHGAASRAGLALALAATVSLVAACGSSSANPTSSTGNPTTSVVATSQPITTAPADTVEVTAPPADSSAPPGDTQPDPYGVSLQEQADAVTGAGVPGVVLLGRHGDKTVEVASGVASLDGGEKVSTATEFRAGSVAKSFVATVLLQLVDEGVVTLDDNVEQWKPGLISNGADISLRELLGNRSGLFDFVEDPRVLQPYLDGDFAHEWTSEQLVAIANEHPSNFAPGTATLYSNTDYTVAGLVIEAATSNTVATEINNRIIGPLSLDSTSVPIDGTLTGPYAHGYYVTDKLQDVTAISPSMSSFGGNLVSTVDDLATFFRELFAGRLIPPALLTEMQTSTTSLTGETLGLGLQVIQLPCGTFIGHTGSTPGYKAGAMVDLEHDRQFVFLANSLTLDDSVGSDAAARALDEAVNSAACGAQ